MNCHFRSWVLMAVAALSVPGNSGVSASWNAAVESPYLFLLVATLSNAGVLPSTDASYLPSPTQNSHSQDFPSNFIFRRKSTINRLNTTVYYFSLDSNDTATDNHTMYPDAASNDITPNSNTTWPNGTPSYPIGTTSSRSAPYDGIIPTTRPTTYYTTTTTTTKGTTLPTTTTTTSPSPFTLPPVDEAAKMARFIVHFSSWCSLSYFSQRFQYPMARVYSFADGLPYSGTGVPYFMTSPRDVTYQELQSDNRCSLIVSLSETPYCSLREWDPEDPRCAQVILSGRFQLLDQNSYEMNFAKRALWDRHPAMETWFVNASDHDWHFARLEVERVTVIDTFGGRKYPSVSDYFSQAPVRPISVELH